MKHGRTVGVGKARRKRIAVERIQNRRRGPCTMCGCPDPHHGFTTTMR